MATKSRAVKRDKSGSTEPKEPRYIIDPQRIEDRGRAASALLESRMCAESREKLGSRFETARSDFAELRRLIRDNCQLDANYLHSHLPIMETAFRLLLIAPREPVVLSTLHGQIDDLWSSAPWPRQISAKALARILGSDGYYGIVEVGSRDVPKSGRRNTPRGANPVRRQTE